MHLNPGSENLEEKRFRYFRDLTRVVLFCLSDDFGNSATLRELFYFVFLTLSTKSSTRAGAIGNFGHTGPGLTRTWEVGWGEGGRQDGAVLGRGRGEPRRLLFGRNVQQVTLLNICTLGITVCTNPAVYNFASLLCLHHFLWRVENDVVKMKN